MGPWGRSTPQDRYGTLIGEVRCLLDTGWYDKTRNLELDKLRPSWFTDTLSYLISKCWLTCVENGNDI